MTTARHRKPTTASGGNVNLLDKIRNLNSASTKRSVRTAIDVALGFLATIAVIVPLLSDLGVPVESETKIAGIVVAATLVISKVKNKLEELGFLPAFMKDTEQH
ncbi:hypothetical protein OG474_29980 [Kribbella sp. NBC_01505]|uniref:hypothetical protein n=1 Tax=Kribbella sp. NBC_01505 TaxID=2903580 RepID=UPI00386AF674